ncbi:MAG: hypothetical protein JXR84_29070 [Anaerolineae bacterium]|nr:hypothetical protein [Anaerolineae bacterium]
MELKLEGLLVALAFLLPGFLTSTLIRARTPAMGRQPSTFEETLDSLLRSVFTHLIIAPFALIIVRFIVLGNDSSLLSRIGVEGISAYYDARPVEVSLILLLWLVVAFGMALLFGYKWDPLEFILRRLVKKTGTLSEDPFFLLRQHVGIRRAKEQPYFQLWIQARLKNGSVYQGEFVTIGYRDADKNRELLLANATYFPPPPSPDAENILPTVSCDFAYIDLANCDSLEMRFANAAPSGKKEVV